MTSYFLSYQRQIPAKELDPTLYAAEGMETLCENTVIDGSPVDWFLRQKERYATHKISIFFCIEINEQQKEKLIEEIK